MICFETKWKVEIEGSAAKVVERKRKKRVTNTCASSYAVFKSHGMSCIFLRFIPWSILAQCVFVRVRVYMCIIYACVCVRMYIHMHACVRLYEICIYFKTFEATVVLLIEWGNHFCRRRKLKIILKYIYLSISLCAKKTMEIQAQNTFVFVLIFA